jgi:hypothetical protein
MRSTRARLSGGTDPQSLLGDRRSRSRGSIALPSSAARRPGRYRRCGCGRGAWSGVGLGWPMRRDGARRLLDAARRGGRGGAVRWLLLEVQPRWASASGCASQVSGLSSWNKPGAKWFRSWQSRSRIGPGATTSADRTGGDRARPGHHPCPATSGPFESTRTRSCRTDRPRSVQSRRRRAPASVREDSGGPRAPHPQQAGTIEPHPSGYLAAREIKYPIEYRLSCRGAKSIGVRRLARRRGVSR